MRRLVLLGVGIAAVSVLAGCGSHSAPAAASDTNSASTSATEPIRIGPAGTLVVFAASSLRPVFPALGAAFEAAHPGVAVNFEFGASPDLAARIDRGEPGDLFAAAEIPAMQRVIDANQVTEQPQVFAKNTLVIVTAPGNPKHIARLEDLISSGVSVAVCAPTAACGWDVGEAESDAGIDLSRTSQVSSVADVLAKVTAGQADAGLVYATDAKAAGDQVTTVEFRQAAREVTGYPIAVLAGSKQPALAHAFEAVVAGPPGQAALAAAGFGTPH
jgi:molybdate transport system substrate-binding protein